MITHRQRTPIGRSENRNFLQWLFVGPFLWVHVLHGQGTTDAAWTSATATGNGDAETRTNDMSFFGHTSGSSPSIPPNLRPFQLVLPRAHLLGDWDGLRPKLEEHGFTPSLTLVSDIAGNVTGGNSQGVTEAGNLGLNLFFDLEKLAGLSGGSFLVSMSQRWGTSLSKEHVGNVFTIQQVYGGQTFHLIDVAYEQKLLDDRLTFRLG